jgi:hypothetical protein
VLDNQDSRQDLVSKPQTFFVALFIGIFALFALAFFFNVSPAAHAADNTYYAKPGGTGDCSAWNTACGLQEAINKAARSNGKVLAAKGIYTPGSNQSDSFELKDGVTIEGGYLVSGTTATRDWKTHKTILSGDIDNNDTTDNGLVTDVANITGANAYHVVTGSDLGPDTVLDGVYITAGSATGTDDKGNAVGGGLKNVNGNPTIQHVVFVGNLAGVGGGMYNESGSPSLTNVTFENNSSIELAKRLPGIEAYGGGVYTKEHSNPTFNEVHFTGNYAEDSGGGIAIEFYSEPTFTNVEFVENVSERTSGAVYIYLESHTSFNNVTFSGNKSDNGSDQGKAGAILITHDSNVTFKDVDFIRNISRRTGGAVLIKDDCNLTFENVTFQENESIQDNGGAISHGEKANEKKDGDGNIIDVDVDTSHATFTNVDFIRNKANNGGAISYISATAELINNRFQGNIATSSGGAIYSYDSDQTYVNATFNDNEAIDGRAGGIYSAYSDPTFTNITLSGNRASRGSGMYNNDSNPTIQNSILWGNGVGADDDQIYNKDSTPTYNYSLVEGKSAADLGGTGNLDSANPLFVRSPSPGPDETWGTDDDDHGDLHLQPDSPAVNMGNNDYLTITTDLDGGPRIEDNTVDLGAYEGAAPTIAASVASGTHSAKVGEVITYTYRLTNTSNVTFDPVVVVDNRLGSVALDSSSLAPGAVATGILSYTVQEGDLPGPLATTVVVKGTVQGTPTTVTNTAYASVGLRSESNTAPIITIAPATEVLISSATLHAQVNPNNLDTTVTFRWGETMGGPYPNEQTVTETFSGTQVQTASLSISGLTPGTTYFYSAAASNADGSATSTEQSLTIPIRAAYASTPTVGSLLDVGTVTVGTSDTTSLELREVGSVDLVVDLAEPALSGTDADYFRIESPSSFPVTIADGSDEQVTLTIVCTPQQSGTHTATLTLATNDTAQPTVSYPLRCTGAQDGNEERVYLPLVQR